MGRQLRYLEIAQTLKDRIRTGRYPHGECLPSQRELAKIFTTSLMTARQALAVLEEEGIIKVVHGLGTFVSAPEIHSDDISLQGFQNEMDQHRTKIINKTIGKEYGLSDPLLDAVFRGTDMRFSRLSCLRMLDDTPVILQRSYVEGDEYKRVIEEYQEDQSLYQLFIERTAVMITLGREIVSSVLLEGEELKLLGLNTPCTAFRSRRISISLDARVVLYDEAYLPGQYIIMASSRQGKNNRFKYIINRDGISNSTRSFNDPDLWEDLI